MTGSALIDRLIDAGFHGDDAISRAVLVQNVERRFGELHGRGPSWQWFVPGRIEVFGKHTDYAGGRSLVGAVPRGFAVAAAPSSERRVRVVDAADSTEVTIDVSEDRRKFSGWSCYVAAVAHRLSANFPDAPLGLDLVFASDLPRAAGLSSSSALVVLVATALVRRGRLDERPDWRRVIRSPHELAWYFGSIESGRDYPGMPGLRGVGTRGGSEDHTAILTCRAGHLSQNRYLPIVPLGETPLPPDWTLIVTTSGVAAEKSAEARERYNRLSLASDALLSLWNSGSAHEAASLGPVLEGGAAPQTELLARIARSRDRRFAPEYLRRRFTHLIGEDARVAEAARAFALADSAAVGALAADSQRDADELLENQIPETRTLVDTAVESGATAASSFGAGFGGSVWALVLGKDHLHFATDWLARYRGRFPQHHDATWFVARPSPALIEVAGEPA